MVICFGMIVVLVGGFSVEVCVGVLLYVVSSVVVVVVVIYLVSWGLNYI